MIPFLFKADSAYWQCQYEDEHKCSKSIILESWFSSIHISLKASAGEKKSVYLENGVLDIGSCTQIVIEIIRFWYKMTQIP